MISYVLAVLSGLAVIAADQGTKFWVIKQFSLGESKPFFKGFLDFIYTTNGGGAWGILQNHTWLLLSLTIIIMLICITLMIKYGLENKTLFWAICLILGGGLGNMIDRIFRGGQVIDFLHFTFVDFPIFNVADCAVCIGAALLVLYFIIGMIRDEKQSRLKAAEALAAKVAKVSRTETEKINVSEQKPTVSGNTESENGEN